MAGNILFGWSQRIWTSKDRSSDSVHFLCSNGIGDPGKQNACCVNLSVMHGLSGGDEFGIGVLIGCRVVVAIVIRKVTTGDVQPDTVAGSRKGRVRFCRKNCPELLQNCNTATTLQETNAGPPDQRIAGEGRSQDRAARPSYGQPLCVPLLLISETRPQAAMATHRPGTACKVMGPTARSGDSPTDIDATSFSAESSSVSTGLNRLRVPNANESSGV